MRFSGLVVVFLTTLTAHSQPAGSWEVLSNAPVSSYRHDDVFFVNSDVGWIVNLAGEIHKTTDGGQSWTRQADVNGIFFRSTGFADENVGWAGNLGLTNDPNTEQVLFETRDGGTRWNDISGRITGPKPAGICGIWVVNEQIIYAVGRWNGPAIFLKTTDGGQNWVATDLQPLATGLVDVYFFDEDTGLIVGGIGVGSSIVEQNSSRTVILYTEDGGDTWEPRYTSETTGKWGWKFSFPTPDTGYVATQGPTLDGIVLKTTDGGPHWEEKFVGEGLGFSGIGFATPTSGWVGADDASYETNDGGESWHEVSNVGTNINRFRMLGDSLGYAVGKQVYKYTASKVTSREASPDLSQTLRLEQNYPNPFSLSTAIEFDVAQPGHVRLRIYNLLGEVVATLFDKSVSPGRYQASWGATRFASGAYLYRLEVGELFQTKELMLVR